MMMTQTLTKFLLSLAVMAGLLISQGFYQESPAQGIQYGGVQTSANAQEQARHILARLLAANDLPRESVMNMTVVEDKSLNAATNGREIQFTTGLWNALQTNDQRAFVIAHELAHIDEGHIPQTMMRRAGLQVVDQLLLDRLLNVSDATLRGQLWNVARQAGMTLVDLKFSRGAEYEADQRGLEIMANAGYNPAAAIGTLEILQAASATGTPEFLRSHPINENRIRALVAQMQQPAVRSTIQNVPPGIRPGLVRTR